MKQLAVFAATVLLFAASAFGQAVMPSTEDQQAKEQQEVAVVFDEFLHAWLVEQDINKAIGFFEQDSLFVSGTKSMFYNEALDTDEWLRKVLVMWLFKDHGEISALGHGDPRSAGYAQLPTDPKDIAQRIQPKTLMDAVKEVKVDLYYKDDQGANTTYGAAVFLKHVSGEVILFAFKKVNGQWKINGLLWIVG